MLSSWLEFDLMRLKPAIWRDARRVAVCRTLPHPHSYLYATHYALSITLGIFLSYVISALSHEVVPETTSNAQLASVRHMPMHRPRLFMVG
jgi:hypothetical protein